MDIRKLALQQEPFIIDTRRDLHRHPELSWQEERTTRMLADALIALGIPVQRFPDKTGVMGILRGEKSPSDAVVVLRADIDALPIAERTGLPFESVNAGVMHACGHDCHAAMLLGAARILNTVKAEFSGEVRLLFQAAEEINSGAEYCLAQGALAGAGAVFGLHVWGDLDAPYFNFADGSRMASCDNFTITVRGVPAHGSAPHQGVDAIVAAAAIVTQVQTLVSRGNDPRSPLVVTIGEIHGGKRFNIIADTVEMIGTVRTHDKAVRAQVEPQLRRVAEHTAAALGATAELDYRYLAPPVINAHPALTQTARNAAVKLFGADALHDMPPLMSSEDFALYMESVPGVFGFLGARNPALGITAANHNHDFTVDEAVLQRGAALYAQFACDFFAQRG